MDDLMPVITKHHTDLTAPEIVTALGICVGKIIAMAAPDEEERQRVRQAVIAHMDSAIEAHMESRRRAN
jgi:hypothetical protein